MVPTMSHSSQFNSFYIYADVHCKLVLKFSKTVMLFRYYAFNLLMPCTLTMVLVLLGFTLNPFSCEKVGLQISVALAITIFMTIMASMTPQTSESVPLLGVFFQSCMILSVCATAFTVYVQSIHFRCHSRVPMGSLVCLQFVGNYNLVVLDALLPS